VPSRELVRGSPQQQQCEVVLQRSTRPMRIEPGQHAISQRLQGHGRCSAQGLPEAIVSKQLVRRAHPFGQAIGEENERVAGAKRHHSCFEGLLGEEAEGWPTEKGQLFERTIVRTQESGHPEGWPP
jgi:hypothetical protein